MSLILISDPYSAVSNASNNTPKPVTFVPDPPKQIVINNVIANAIMYIVPVGRKFTGNVTSVFVGGTASATGTIINGITIQTFGGVGTTAAAAAGSLCTYILLAGSYVKEVSHYTSTIVGIESAA